MKIKLVTAEEGHEYIRHARKEIVKACGGDVHSSSVDPISCATYLFAYDTDPNQPIGMAEFAFHDQVYDSFDETPYASICDLAEFCDFPKMCGIRTIYVEPEYRVGRPIYLYLALAATYIFYALGARYATATTNANDSYLNNLYTKTGGSLKGHFCTSGVTCQVALYLFDLSKFVHHRATRRIVRNMEVDIEKAKALRTRRAA